MRSAGMTLRRYRVRMLEECDCPHCGCPVMEGDTAVEVFRRPSDENAAESGLCSAGCACRWLLEHPEE